MLHNYLQVVVTIACAHVLVYYFIMLKVFFMCLCSFPLLFHLVYGI